MNSRAVPYAEFTEVALSYSSQLHSAAHRFERNTADADDLVQETYCAAFQHYRELHNLAHCRGWLYRILHHQAVTRYRRERSRPRLVFVDLGAEDGAETLSLRSFDDDLLERFSLKEIRGVVDALPPDLRVVVTLYDIEGFSYTEIAAITNRPVGTVRSRIARARTRLMRKLRIQAQECGIHRKTVGAAVGLAR